MKKLFSTVIFLFSATITLMAQSSGVQKAAKSIFTLTTFNADGNILSTTHGIFVGENGEGICPWKPFEGADSAIVIGTTGKPMIVDAIIGVNAIYDVCKIKVLGNTTPATLAANGIQAGGKAWISEYSIKKPTIHQATARSVEKFMDKYSYYILDKDASDVTSGCPLINDQGEVLAILEQSINGGIGKAVDASFASSLTTDSRFAANDANLSKTNIRAQMPSEEKAALITLLMSAETGNQKNYNKYINDFIQMFPHAVDGYSARANQQIRNNQIEAAEETMEQAISKSTDKAAAHFEYAKLIFNKVLYNTDSTFTRWNFDKALSESQKAYDIDAQPTYMHQQGMITYSMGNYQEAYNIFSSLVNTPLSKNEIFFEMAQCKQMLNAPSEEILVYLDSAVAACPQPLTNLSAPYLLARGEARAAAGLKRPALADYNMYDTLMLGNVSAEFYEKRHTLEVSMRQYQQALNDIAHAILLNPREPVYAAEMATLCLRVNQPENAIKAADLCLEMDPNSTDGLIIKGLALIQLKKKEEGLLCLQKANELGDERAQTLIDKYK